MSQTSTISSPFPPFQETSPDALATNGSTTGPTKVYNQVVRPPRIDSRPGFKTAPQMNGDSKIEDGKQGSRNVAGLISVDGANASLENHDIYPLSSTSNIPKIELETPAATNSSPEHTTAKWLPTSATPSSPTTSSGDPTPAFQGLLLDIPSSGLSEEIGTNNLKFSARGSMLIDGKRLKMDRQNSPAKVMPIRKEPAVAEDKKTIVTSRKRAMTAIAERPQTRPMSTDEELLSEKVRLFYSTGSDANTDKDSQGDTATRISLRWQDAAQRNRASTITTTSRATTASDLSRLPPSPTIPREYNELAGGTEDWLNVDNADVDRYGFIVPRSPTTSVGDRNDTSNKQTPVDPSQGLQRVSTSLQLASETPRRKRTLRRTPSIAKSTKSEYESGRSPSNGSMRRPSSSKSASIQRNRSASRSLVDRLPHNRDRRVLSEASDMLTLPRASTTNALFKSATEGGTNTPTGTYTFASTPEARRKENGRQEKWRKMARPAPVKPGVVGGGMTFTFDTTSTKLIERTWKGIPDSWRAAAWYCFLSVSAEKYNKRNPSRHCICDDDLIAMFHEYQSRNCPDDVQIDIDVPRTISSHIMFRRRYRGGQRLLFRVLHAISIHFAEQGYVQGMAALAATLLAYYEEEKAFIMLVRLWELRGLEKLYKAGFGGLMEALNDFEKSWLGQGELKTKFDNLHIYPTAYGTRWYLTLFNYSIPFPAQLRVWDVFMLLGDNDTNDANDHEHNNIDNSNDNKSSNQNEKQQNETEKEKANFGTTLDVLHATSAALIDGMRDILLESDFEEAMKALTSWVPIRDEDLFMRVAKAEWKMNIHRRKQHQKVGGGVGVS